MGFMHNCFAVKNYCTPLHFSPAHTQTYTCTAEINFGSIKSSIHQKEHPFEMKWNRQIKTISYVECLNSFIIFRTLIFWLTHFSRFARNGFDFFQINLNEFFLSFCSTSSCSSFFQICVKIKPILSMWNLFIQSFARANRKSFFGDINFHIEIS